LAQLAPPKANRSRYWQKLEFCQLNLEQASPIGGGNKHLKKIYGDSGMTRTSFHVDAILVAVGGDQPQVGLLVETANIE